MNDLSVERTPQVIATEINMIVHQTKKILLTNAIEIGRRLKEAKSLVEHGEWGKWLEESVSYSQSTACRLIRICEEYGASLPDGSGTSNLAPVPNLTYTQALLLLGLPEGEREEFIAKNDVATMTKQELQQALRDRDHTKQEKEQIPQENKIGNAPPASNNALPTHNLPTEIDPNAPAKYVERCDACCKTISTTFFELTTALTNLTHLDARLKEEKEKRPRSCLNPLLRRLRSGRPPQNP